MRRTNINILASAMLAGAYVLPLGCGTDGDGPCQPETKQVGLEEADEGLVRRAKRIQEENKTVFRDGTAVIYECGWKDPVTGEFKQGYAKASYQEVLECFDGWLEGEAPEGLSACLENIARFAFSLKMVEDQHLPAEKQLKALEEVRDAAKCVEKNRFGDVKASPHQLNRGSADEDWVPAVLWGTLMTVKELVEGAAVPAPVIFILKPGKGSPEQSCVDAPNPGRKCTDSSGCNGSGGGGQGGGDLGPPPDTGGDLPTTGAGNPSGGDYQ